jgi:outer membrane protein assembly factor BamB
MFVVTNNGLFINLEKSSGKILWATNILKVLKNKKQKTKITGFVLGSDKIYATTLNGYLIVSSAITGKVESFKKIGDVINAPPIINNSSLYILTENSRIIGFK